MRVLVAHPAQQHSYRLAAALKREGMLGKYATTVYYKRGSLTRIVSGLLKGGFKVKAQSRTCGELEDNEVVQFCEGYGLLKLLALNTPILRKRYYDIKYKTADRFALKAADYAIKNTFDAVVAYDDTSPLLFEYLKEKSPDTLCILDMSAASILYMRSIYEKDFELAPSFAERLKSERRICWNEDNIERAKREIASADKFLVPSDFTARSLEYSGVQAERIYKCPYGVDVSEFLQKEYDDFKRPIRFIYVGGVKELKGIYYLLEAFYEIPRDRAVLKVVGKYNPDDADIKKYSDTVEFTGSVLHSEIPDLLRESDVFIFPSLGDSFSLAVTEAAACGLPVIYSENTGAGDCFTDGAEGFSVPVQNKDALVEIINFFIDNPAMIKTMGSAAREAALRYSWEAYNKRIAEIFRSFENESNSSR